MVYTEHVSPMFDTKKATRACTRCGANITRLQARRTACDACREIIHKETEARRQRAMKDRKQTDRPCQHPGCTATFRSVAGNRRFCDTHSPEINPAVRRFWKGSDGDARVVHVEVRRPVIHDYTHSGICRCGARVPNLPSYLSGASVVCAACSERREEYPR